MVDILLGRGGMDAILERLFISDEERWLSVLRSVLSERGCLNIWFSIVCGRRVLDL